MNKIPQKIKDILKAVEEEKEIKMKYDATFDLAKESNNDFISIDLGVDFNTDKPIRLLDEGAILYGDSTGDDPDWDIRLFLMKETIKNWYNGLSDDYVGMIKLSHMDYISMPLSIGSWTKKDLKLIDNKDGRYGLDIMMKLDNLEENPLAKYVKNMKIPFGVSVEMDASIDEKLSEEKGFPIVKWIDIKDFAIVGQGANTASNGIKLKKGEEDMNFEELMNNFKKKKENLNTDVQTEKSDEEVSKKEGNAEKVEETTVEEPSNNDTTDEAISAEELSQIIELSSEYIEALEAKNIELKQALADRKKVEESLSKLASIAGKNAQEKLGKTNKEAKKSFDPING